MKTSEIDNIYGLIQSSFEKNLYRNYDDYVKFVNDGSCNFIVYRNEIDRSKIEGFISYWNIGEKFIYIEHFAVDSERRGLGIGNILLIALQRIGKHQILEVEPPNTEIDIQRIKFYEKFGFILNDTEYYQPPYNASDSKTPLKIMCTKELFEEEYNFLVSEIHKKVYGV